MFDVVRVVGSGRAGSAISARLAARGIPAAGPAPPERTLVLLCVPDDAIHDAAGAIPEGPWVAHVSGVTPLAALDPHAHRFSVHPLQTLVRSKGADQLDGAWAAVSADSPQGLARGRWLAATLGLTAFELADDRRALYHAGASMASNFLVTLHRAASSLLAAAGAPPEALVPLIRRTVENGFELTGPIARGDRGTVERHVRAIEAERPELLALYQALAEATRP